MSKRQHEVAVRVPATTANLGPAFDCLGITLGLYNEVLLEIAPRVEVTVEGEGRDYLPQDSQNLVLQAAHLLSEHTGHPLPNLRVRQSNDIPVSSGLGSSAAAVVAGLLGADLLLGTNLSHEELLALAALLEGHADNVAAALYGGVVLVNESGGHQFVEQIPLPPLRMVVVLPAFDLSTRQARAVLPAQVPLRDAVFNVGRTALLVWALTRGDHVQLRLAMEDRLHQPYRIPLIPGMAEAFEVARTAGAAVCLSGAGPSLLAFAPGQHKLLAEALVATFARAGLHSRYWILETVNQGATVALRARL